MTDRKNIKKTPRFDRRNLSKIKAILAENVDFAYRSDLLNYDLEKFYKSFYRAIREAVDIISKIPKSSPIFKAPAIIINRMFGSHGKNHALKHPPIFWHRALKEPDVTKLLEKVLKNTHYFQTFVSATCECLGLDVPDFSSLLLDNSVMIEAEYLAEEKKRIDLFLAWGQKNTAQVFLYEVKFNCFKADNPFKIYENAAKNELKSRRAEAKKPVLIFLIQSPKSEESFKKNKETFPEWKILYWHELLPCWEKNIQTQLTDKNIPYEQKSNCASLRRSIFEILYKATSEK